MKLWSDAVVHWSAIVASHGNLFVGGSAERSIDRGRTTDQVWNTRRSAATGSDRGVAQGGGLYGKGRGKRLMVSIGPRRLDSARMFLASNVG